MINLTIFHLTLTETVGAGLQPMSNDAAAILEKSQKTLENIQKTVTEATDEIHKTISENLTDLKSLENDLAADPSPTPSSGTTMARPGESASRTGTADGSIAPQSSGSCPSHRFHPPNPSKPLSRFCIPMKAPPSE